MEFLAGMITAVFLGFIGYKIYIAWEQSKAREAYIPPSGSGLDNGRPVEENDFKRNHR